MAFGWQPKVLEFSLQAIPGGNMLKALTPTTRARKETALGSPYQKSDFKNVPAIAIKANTLCPANQRAS